MRLAKGDADTRRLGEILAELFDTDWIQALEGGGINMMIAVGDRRRMEELIGAYGRKVKHDFGMKERHGRDVYDLTIT